MGGDYEDKVEAPAVKPAKTAGASSRDETTVSGVRFHLSRGQVHFHHDKAGLKVYVPVAVWWNAWQRLRMPSDTSAVDWSYIDLDNESQIEITSGVEGDAVRVSVAVSPFTPPATYDRVWHALENFTTKTHKG